MTYRLLLPLGVCLLFATASAAPIMPSFSPVSSAPAGWYVDRYDPAAFEFIGPYNGRADVLRISIRSADDAAHRPSTYNSTFYNTQGRKYDLPSATSGTLSASLFVPGSWASSTAGFVRTDMWATMLDASHNVSAYPVLGFANFDGAARFRAFGQDGVWHDFAAPIHYNQWNNLSIAFTGTSFSYGVNGIVVLTDANTNGSVNFANVIMQAYNFGQDYAVNWSNSVPEPSTVLLTGAGLIALSLFRRR